LRIVHAEGAGAVDVSEGRVDVAETLLHDAVDAWTLDADGRYKRVAEQGVSAQRALAQLYRPS
jgi:hypothetical protein